MDTDFQEQYQNAERAYGQADYASAHAIARGLLGQLMLEPDPENEAAILNWRALVFLLLGNIELHGLNQPEQADNSYQQVLQCEPQDILAELAKQGVERCRTQEQTNLRTASQGDALSTNSRNTSPLSTSPLSASALPDLLRDPFLTTTQDQLTEPAAPQTTASQTTASQTTAMPWLEETAITTEPSNPSPVPSTSLVPSTSPPSTTFEPEQAPELDSLLSPRQEAAETETSTPEVNPLPKPVPVQALTTEPESAEETEDPAEQQPLPRAAAIEAEIEIDVLEGSSLRVRITPQPEEPISIPAEQTGPRSWLKKLKRLSTRR